MGIERPRLSSPNQGLGGTAPLSSISVTPAQRWGAHPTLPRLRRRRRRRLGCFPPRPQLSPLCLSLHARRDRPEPRVAGPGSWTETSARRRALPCGGKRLSASSPRNFQDLPNRGARSRRFSSLSLPGGCCWGP